MIPARYWRDVRDDADELAMRRALTKRRRAFVWFTARNTEPPPLVEADLDHLRREADAELLLIALPPVPQRTIPPPRRGSLAVSMAWAPLTR